MSSGGVSSRVILTSVGLTNAVPASIILFGVSSGDRIGNGRSGITVISMLRGIFGRVRKFDNSGPFLTSLRHGLARRKGCGLFGRGFRSDFNST